MKTKMIAMVLVFVFLLLPACSINSEKIQLGKYVLKDAQSEDWSWILLQENNQFEFNLANNISYRPSGTYVVENDELLLKVNDEVQYRFQIKDHSLIFKGGGNSGELLDLNAVYELKSDD